MPLLDSVEEVFVESEPRAGRTSSLASEYFSRLIQYPNVPWNLTTGAALLILILLWAERMFTTWATWGNLSIDSGRELYVPSVLAEGKMLYRDIWYLYGPAAPYFNSYLFRLFGVRMEVLYWAGSLSALACAILLFLVGKRLSSWLAGWTAGAVVILQAFQPGLFCFPLAYSFASVYGCVIGCLFLYLAVRACSSTHWAWVFAAGTASSAALLLKLEFGIACYAALFLLVVARFIRQRSWKSVGQDIITILPGIVVCILVIHWMISIAGFEFITQENLAGTWPTSFFMRSYGKMWLARTGFALNGAAFSQAVIRILFSVAIVAEAYGLIWWKRRDPRSLYLRMAIFLFILGYYVLLLGFRPIGFLSAVFFPRDMVLYVSIAALVAWGNFLLHQDSDRRLSVAVILAFSGLLAFRILLNLSPIGYPIYYDGPSVLSFLLLLRPIVPRSGRSVRFPFLGESIICVACLLVVALQVPTIDAAAPWNAKLTTDRGVIVTSKQTANNYQAAILFMREKASRGESVLAVPEDTSLYFLSGTHCPTRLFAFTPGLLAPGKMTDELIEEIERGSTRYLLWSNRIFPEYGVPIFGSDFNRPLADYFKSHYHRVGILVPPLNTWELTFVVWERNDRGQQQ